MRNRDVPRVETLAGPEVPSNLLVPNDEGVYLVQYSKQIKNKETLTETLSEDDFSSTIKNLLNKINKIVNSEKKDDIDAATEVAMYSNATVNLSLSALILKESKMLKKKKNNNYYSDGVIPVNLVKEDTELYKYLEERIEKLKEITNIPENCVIVINKPGIIFYEIIDLDSEIQTRYKGRFWDKDPGLESVEDPILNLDFDLFSNYLVVKVGSNLYVANKESSGYSLEECPSCVISLIKINYAEY